MKKYERFFSEVKQVGVLYHSTTYENLLQILKDDMLLKGNHNYISFTRNKINVKSSLPCQIIVDGDKLSNSYKVEPFDYFKGRYNDYSTDEQEERVLIRMIKNLHKYVIKVIINYNEDNFNYYLGRQYNKDFNNYLKEVKTNNKHSIDVVVKNF